MKLEIGKYYKTRDGRKAGPIEESEWNGAFTTRVVGEKGYCLYEMTGRHGDGGCEESCIPNRPWLDIIAELEESVGIEMKTWGELTDAEKGALLLAHHEDKEIEWYDSAYKHWETCILPIWEPTLHYRVKKATINSTKVLYMYYESGYTPFVSTFSSDPTHKITFDTIDGDPDCSSIKMEKV